MGTEQLSLLRQVVPTSVRMDIVQSHSHSLASVRYSHCFNQVISACEGGVSYAASISLNLVSQIRSLTFRREWAWGRGYNNLPISILYSVLNIWALYPLHGVKKNPLLYTTTACSITYHTILHYFWDHRIIRWSSVFDSSFYVIIFIRLSRCGIYSLEELCLSSKPRRVAVAVVKLQWTGSVQ